MTLEISSEESALTAEQKKQFTPEQLYKLELARIESRHGNFLGGESLVPILVPFGFFAMTVAIVALVVWARFRRNRMMHETVRLLVEKGQPLPAELFQHNVPKPKSDLRRGLIWSAVGLGAIGFFLADHDSDWGLGFIPLFVGLGYLLAWKLGRSSKPESGV